ncbi:PAS domain-containing sensor histidine kinase [Romboutsia sp. 1001713B170207_170306_H8]|uniref:PAS domain-containing sensor histidine kinase n=1 Tax=Romboutsia sp. 1001713B170207_170306_H8 TaxID=2787112 RepID=UPI00189B1C3D|nr:PAS domain-containing sensor histidine kinase [Romboutsia sp. 1001713B170207_170306_H8]
MYKKIVKNSPIAYCCADIINDNYGNHLGIKIKDINKSFEELFETKLEYINNKNIMNMLSDEQIKDWISTYKEVDINSKKTIRKYNKFMNIIYEMDIYNKEDKELYMVFRQVSKVSPAISPAMSKAPFPAWIKDIDGKYTDVNNAFLKSMGLKITDVIGKTEYDIMEKNQAEESNFYDKSVLKKDTLHTYRQAIIKDNKKEYYEITKWPCIDYTNGCTIGTMGISVEITKEVISIEELEKNQEILSQITNNIDEIIIIENDKTPVYISSAFEKMFGIRPEDMNLYDSCENWDKYWDDRIEYEKKYNEYDNEKEIGISKFKNEYGYKWLKKEYMPIRSNSDDVKKRVGIIRDITKDVEANESLEKLRMDFFANLSHELRTPINIILSSLQVINLRLDKLNQDDYEYFTKYLGILRQNGLRLLKLVNNLIDTTKVDSGHFDHSPQNGNIISFIEDVCMSVSEFIKNHNLNLIFDTDCEEKIIAFDKDNMERIMLNLLSNAIKFSKDKGNIEVSIYCEESIKIKVRDNGIGIPKDKLDGIFGRFEQVKSKMKNEREGSGIGLSLVKYLVEMHDGSISVDSELEVGSEFIINLPDKLCENNKNKVDRVNNVNLTNISNMNIEFSDIY